MATNNAKKRGGVILKAMDFVAVIALGVIIVSNVGYTGSYYSDLEKNESNLFKASSLAISLNPESLTAEEMLPSDQIGEIIIASNSGELPFEYKVKSEEIIAEGESPSQLCAALTATMTQNGTEVWNSSLLGIETATTTLAASASDTWGLEIYLPSEIGSELSGLSCTTTLIFDSWQTGFHSGTAFHHSKNFLINISAGIWDDEENYFGAYSPIADTYVVEDHPDWNRGGYLSLDIQSHENKNIRTFIKFAFQFPNEAAISSAYLKLYMSNQPSENRTFDAYRVATSWIEKGTGGITWASQPGVADNPIDSAESGTTPGAWISWDVTDDMYYFNLNPDNNFGWRITDHNEGNSSSINANFVSRDSNEQDKRPQLEVTFSAPPANTNYLVINEVYYEVGSSRGSDTNNEWIEIYNPTDNVVNISGWRICDNTTCDILPTSDPIPSHGFAVITNKAETWDKWPEIPTDIIKIALENQLGGGLSNTGDKVSLEKPVDSNFEIVDEMSYGTDISSFNPALPLSGEGKSLARIIKGYDSNQTKDWIINASPNPGTNPGSNGSEKMIFTTDGVFVSAVNLETETTPPIEQDETTISREQTIVEEQIVEKQSEPEETLEPENTEPSAEPVEQAPELESEPELEPEPEPETQPEEQAEVQQIETQIEITP